MKIGLITENSQCSKNTLIYESLRKSTTNEVINFGMKEDENTLTYVQAGLLSAILLNSKCVDFIVTGCGTGEGAMMSLNSYSGVTCGLIESPLDAFLFSQINAGNAISIPYAKDFGWGAEIKLEYIFKTLFNSNFGGGYPKERYESEKYNREKLLEIKNVTQLPLKDVLNKIDQDFLFDTINRVEFKNYFFDNAKDEEIKRIIEKVLNFNKK